MKNLLFLSVLFLSACLDSPYRVNEVQAAGVTQYVTNTAQPTRTPIPTATIDYQKTAEVAQSTADEARRVNAAATAQHEAILNQQLLMTQAIEQQDFMRAQWTAQAATLVIPLTATQQAVMNTQIPLRQTSVASQLTATEHAPTQIVAMLNVEYNKKYGNMSWVANIAGMWGLVVFFVLSPLVLFYKWRLEDRKLAIKENEVIDDPKNNRMGGRMYSDGKGNFKEKKGVPCTPEQLKEFAEAITKKTKTMKINDWEGSETKFTRDSYAPFHMWIRESKLGVPNPHNGLDATEELTNLLSTFLSTGKLPDEYQFLESQATE